MPVTEFALLQLRPEYDERDLVRVAAHCQAVQDDWMRQHQPHTMHAHALDNLSSMYLDQEEEARAPPHHHRRLLITAPWESPDAHREWIASPENQAVFAKLAGFLEPGPEGVLFFHMHHAGVGEDEQPQQQQQQQQELHDVFAGVKNVNVCRMTVPPGARDSVDSAYRALRAEAGQGSAGPSIWAGWRIETEGGQDDLVVFWSDGVGEDQLTSLLAMSDHKTLISLSRIV
jgi:hypothetical protein